MAIPLPAITPFNAFFWTSGADGRLRIQHCTGCASWIHPPSAICPHCLGRSLEPKVVSGLATVEAVTVNHQAWTPDLPVPYAIVRVSLDEDPSIRLTSRMVNCAPESVAIGQRVQVCFEHIEDVYLPYFQPA